MMPLDRFLYLFWLAPFAAGALAFTTLAIFYWRQLREQRGPGGRVFGVFTSVCALSFLLNIAAQVESLQEQVSPLLDLATGFLPPLLLHLVYREERCRAIWVRNGFYALAGAVALTMAGVDARLLPAAWADQLELAPTFLLGASGLLGLLLALLGGKRPQPNPAERRYRIWTRLLLCLMLVAAAATLLDISPAIRILPDYLLLMFFCITLYYKERLIFFDVLLKRGAFLFFALVALGAFFVFRPVSDGKQWLVLAPLFLAAPWAYGLLSRAIDRVWLRRRHTAAEAEHLFVAAAQVADNEDDLRARAARTLTEIFEAPARIVSGAAPPSDDNAQWPIPAQADYLPPCDVAPNPLRAPQTAGGIAAPMGTHGWVCLGPRSNSMPYLSDDRSLLQSLARTLGVVLENVRFREQEQQLRHLATRAELKALRAQINPHFLFNALNAIAGLIQTRPELAEETVEQLAEVFRYTLRKSEKEWVRLDEEIEFVAAYLRVEQARFGARLHVDIAVAANAKPVLVPAMSIQPLVENAIKHGTSAVEGQGRVRLTVTLQDDDVCVEVRDNGPGFPAGFSLDAPENGHGLRNITERLKGYYGERGRLSWENVAEGCLVRLQIPRHAVAVAAPRTSN